MRLYRAITFSLLAGWLLAACGSGSGTPTMAPAGLTPGTTGQATPGAAETAGPAAPTAQPRSAVLSELRNSVDARNTNAADWGSAAEGEQIVAGGGVRTGEESKVRIKTSEGSIIRITANTIFELAEFSPETADPVTKLKLEAGTVWVWVTKALGGGSFEVETPSGVAAVRGSLMSVEHDPATGRTLVTCAEGACTLADRARQTVTALQEGEQTEIAAGGPGPLAARRMTRLQVRAWLDEFPEARDILQRLLDRLGPEALSAGQTACDHAYFPMRPGASWEMASPNGPMSWSVASVSGDTSQATAVMNWSIGDVTGTYNWQCTPEGLVSYDFGALSSTQLGQFATFETSASSGVWLPAADQLVPGYAWTYSFEMAMTLTGEIGSGTSSITSSSEVIGSAPVSVGDQTLDGLTIQQNLHQEVQVTIGGQSAPGTAIDTANTLVFARGVGIVQMTNPDGTTTLVSYTIP